MTDKSILETPLTEAQIVEAVQQKRPGTWRRVKWKSQQFVVDGSVITVVKDGWFRIGIKYDNIRSVIERKKSEDGTIGAPRVRRESSYVRVVGEDGVNIDPFFIVRDRKTSSKKYLQVFPAKMVDIRTKKKRTIGHCFYKDGILIDPVTDAALVAEIETKLKAKAKHSDGPIDTFVIKLNQVLKIK